MTDASHDMPAYTIVIPIIRVKSVGDMFAPIGTVIDWSGNGRAIPLGWMEADGRKLLRSSYPEISGVLGPQYPSKRHPIKRLKAWWRWEVREEFDLPDFSHRRVFGVDWGRSDSYCPSPADIGGETA